MKSNYIVTVFNNENKQIGWIWYDSKFDAKYRALRINKGKDKKYLDCFATVTPESIYAE